MDARYSQQNMPFVYQEFVDAWEDPGQREDSIQAYTDRQVSFIPNLLPELAVQLSTLDTLEILIKRYGEAVNTALLLANSDPDNLPTIIPSSIASPVADQPDSSWLKRTNMVGVNVRTIGSFWNLVKYALTLPSCQDSIHVLPIWEPGVVGSIYGMSSWDLNREFYSQELANEFPYLNTCARQLRAVVNLLHVMGKAVGMDVIPHTDRFSEIVLAHPEFFEWLQRQDTLIVDHSADLHLKVQERIFQFLKMDGTALPGDLIPSDPDALFNDTAGDDDRLRLLFGLRDDIEGREARRQKLIHHLYLYGYEPVPATMAPPYRGLLVNPSPEAKNVDASGQIWRDYTIAKPTPMSRVFGPLTRYKLYEAFRNNADWEIDFSQPRKVVWDYVCRQYGQVQQQYGFDFMRGDMSHVQMRPEGVPEQVDRYYDILGAVKQHIQQENSVKYFGYFAETFLAPRDTILYGEEIDHLEAAEADVTLGDLQSTVLGSPEFLQRFRYYGDLAETRRCTPSFTVITADKDDPRFDQFYQKGNEARLFIALLLSGMPSYMSLGFETRDLHLEPAPNEYYSKLFVFHITDGPKATHGSYVWGKNALQFRYITRLRLYLENIWPKIKNCSLRWIVPPDATGANPVIAWTYKGSHPEFLFVVNTSTEKHIPGFILSNLKENPTLVWEFSSLMDIRDDIRVRSCNTRHYRLGKLSPGEARVYRMQYSQENSKTFA